MARPSDLSPLGQIWGMSGGEIRTEQPGAAALVFAVRQKTDRGLVGGKVRMELM